MKDKVYVKADSILELKGLAEKKQKVEKTIFSLFTDIDLSSDKNLSSIKNHLSTKNTENLSHDSFRLRPHVVEEMYRLDKSEYIRYLKYRYKYEIYPIKNIVDTYPPLVQIEPASICNYRCLFCYQTDKRLSDKRNGHMGLMDLNLFKEIIDELEGNVEAVTLASRGEPTVNKKLAEMLSYMGNKFVASKINTNAYLLDETLANSILSSNLKTIVFSADAASEPLYSSLRVNGDLDKVLRNIEMFHNIKERNYKDNKIITRVSGVKFSNRQDFDSMEKFWSKFVDQVAFVDYNPWENVYDAEKNNIKTACSDLWRRMFIWWDGKAAPCDVDYLTTLMNQTFPNKSIKDLWCSKQYSSIRESHSNGNRHYLSPCSKCVVV